MWLSWNKNQAKHFPWSIWSETSLFSDYRLTPYGSSIPQNSLRNASLQRTPFATLWTVACQDPLSNEFSRQEYWSGLWFPAPGIFPTQGSNLGLLHCRWMLYHLSHQGSPAEILDIIIWLFLCSEPWMTSLYETSSDVSELIGIFCPLLSTWEMKEMA